MTHPMDVHPERFGWRGWVVTPPSMGMGCRLGAPFTRTLLTGQAVEMSCPHGNTTPTTDCSCGVHYGLEPGQMFEMVNHFEGPAVTFGVGLGVTVPDFDERRTQFRRAWRYHVLGIFIPARLAGMQDALTSSHGCPVILGFSEAFARVKSWHLIPDCPDRDWLGELAARRLPDPLPSVREHNEHALSSIWTDGIPDMPTSPMPDASVCDAAVASTAPWALTPPR